MRKIFDVLLVEMSKLSNGTFRAMGADDGDSKRLALGEKLKSSINDYLLSQEVKVVGDGAEVACVRVEKIIVK